VVDDTGAQYGSIDIADSHNVDNFFLTADFQKYLGRRSEVALFAGPQLGFSHIQYDRSITNADPPELDNEISFSKSENAPIIGGQTGISWLHPGTGLGVRFHVQGQFIPGDSGPYHTVSAILSFYNMPARGWCCCVGWELAMPDKDSGRRRSHDD